MIRMALIWRVQKRPFCLKDIIGQERNKPQWAHCAGGSQPRSNDSLHSANHPRPPPLRFFTIWRAYIYAWDLQNRMFRPRNHISPPEMSDSKQTDDFSLPILFSSSTLLRVAILAKHQTGPQELVIMDGRINCRERPPKKGDQPKVKVLTDS